MNGLVTSMYLNPRRSKPLVYVSMYDFLASESSLKSAKSFDANDFSSASSKNSARF